MASISLEHIKKTYEDGVTVIPDLNLEIRDREFLILVGPSGCGKSTTLRMIAGLEDISGGTLKIGDRVVNDLPPKDRDIAMVFQSYALYPHMTVYKNMAFGLQPPLLPLLYRSSPASVSCCSLNTSRAFSCKMSKSCSSISLSTKVSGS